VTDAGYKTRTVITSRPGRLDRRNSSGRPSGCQGSRTNRDPMGDAVEPVSQQVAALQRAGLPHQDQKRRLECVVHVVGIAERLTANAQDHWSVPRDDCFEGRFIASRDKTFQELNLGRAGCGAVVKESLDVNKDRGAMRSIQRAHTFDLF
jgi:hypothetical protein